MPETEIRISPAYLNDLESVVRRLPMSADSVEYIDFSASTEVAPAYDSLEGKWSKHHSELRDSLMHVADVIKAIRESFEGVDGALAENIG